MKRFRDERGANLVEFALVFPVLIALVFGIVDFGAAFNDYQGIRQGVRDGARQGVVSNFGTSNSCGLNGAASTAGDSAKYLICTTKSRAGLGDSTRVMIQLYDTAGNITTSVDKGNQLLVCAERGLSSVTGLYSPLLGSKTLKSKVVMRIEKSLGTLAATSETPTSGSWSWCVA